MAQVVAVGVALVLAFGIAAVRFIRSTSAPPDPTEMFNQGFMAELAGDAVSELVKQRPELHGQTSDQVRALLKQAPAYSKQIAMRDPQPDFRAKLYEFFPRDDPATAQVVVLEEGWRFPGYEVAVWYELRDGSWRSIDSLEWPDAVQFEGR